MADKEWPKSILFVADGLQENFASFDELNRWMGAERAAWNAQATGGNNFANMMIQNFNLLNILDGEQSEAALQRIANEYRPSKGSLGRFVSRLPQSIVKWATYSEIVQPGSTGAQGGAEFITARALAMFYRAIGSNLVGIEQASEIAQSVRLAIDDVNRLRQSDQAFADRFNKFLLQCDTEWKNRIDGYETKARLSAPRTYWNARATHHNSLASKDRQEWFWSVLALIALIAGASYVNFFLILQPASVQGEIASTVQRFLLFGSLLAVAAWWLRQKLRDVRTNEYYSADASERATMIETYAAMRGDGLQDKDLSLILAALYRPGAGNLSDDLGPVLPTEVLVRTLAEFASKK